MASACGYAAPLSPTPQGEPMLVVHHLNDSRSQRVLWLLEELGTPYEIRHYARNATTRLAPPGMRRVSVKAICEPKPAARWMAYSTA